MTIVFKNGDYIDCKFIDFGHLTVTITKWNDTLEFIDVEDISYIKVS